jgi:hypothetical protein
MDEFSRKERELLEDFIYSRYENNCVEYANPEGAKMKQAFSFHRRWGISPMVNVNNLSGHKAWVIISPTPMTRVDSIGIDKAHIDFSVVGDYKCQQSPVMNDDVCTFVLESSYIYYTVYFECDSTWKLSHDNLKMNASHQDIHLVERHYLAAVDSDFKPGRKSS